MTIQDKVVKLKAVSANSYTRAAALVGLILAVMGPFLLFTMGGRNPNDLPWYVWVIIPVLLMAVFWKRMTWAGALAGMVAGAGTAVLWDVLDEIYFGTDLYAMVPAVALGFVCIFVFNPLGRVTEQMERDFENMEHEVVTGEPSFDRKST